MRIDTNLVPICPQSLVVLLLVCGLSACEKTGFVPEPGPVDPTANEVPPDPTTFSLVAVSPTAIDLTWASGGGSTIGFKIVYEVGPIAPVGCQFTFFNSIFIPAVSGPWRFGIAEPGTQYSFRICAEGPNWLDQYSPGLTATITTPVLPPPNPSSFKATAKSASQIDLSWGNGGGTTSGYRISYVQGTSAPLDCASGNQTLEIPNSSNFYSITGLNSKSDYAFRLCAINSNAPPDISVGATASTKTPEALAPDPINLKITTSSTNQIKLSWDSAGGTTAGYRVSYGSGASAPATCDSGSYINPNWIWGTMVYVDNLVPGTQYSFRVCAINSNNPADLSAGVIITGSTTKQLPPNEPTYFTATAASSTQINLSWNSGGGTTAGYRLSYAEGSTAPSSSSCPWGTQLSSGTFSYSLGKLKQGTTYSFRLCSVNANPAPDLSAGVIASVRIPIPSPPDPILLQVSSKTTTSMNLSWNSGGGSTAGYWFAYRQGSTPPAQSDCASGTKVLGTTYSLTNLTVGTQYSIRVCAFNADTPSTISWGVGLTATTQYDPPPAPTDLVATAVSGTEVNLTWKSGGGSTSSYQIRRFMYQEACSDPQNFQSKTSTFLMSGLEPGQSHTLMVCAVNSSTPPQFSAGVTVTVTTPLMSVFKSLAPGEGHTCGLANDGKVYCWGASESGQLGNYSITLEGYSSSPASPSKPVYDMSNEVGQSLNGVVQIVSGSKHTCALTYQGKVFCWGANKRGQLGNGTQQNQSGGKQVEESNINYTNFVSLSAGENHTCGITINGEVSCWGANEAGQLGNLRNIDQDSLRPSPPVQIPPSESTIFKNISAGSAHTCALTSDGRAYCWGANVAGQLGNGETTQVLEPDPTPRLVDTKNLNPGSIFVKIYAGGSHSCGLTSDGKTFCWGLNEFGQLGNGNKINQNFPTLVTSPSSSPLSSFVNLSLGNDHTCGVTNEGKVYCWGNNYIGQLGDATQVNKSVPTLVKTWASDLLGTPLPIEPYFVSVETKSQHTCGITIEGRALCWGANNQSQLGDGRTNNMLAPRLVSLEQIDFESSGNVSNFSSLTAGGSHVCGLSVLGKAYCWGSNSSGQLGLAIPTAPTNIPGLVSTPAGPGFKSLSAGGMHTCGITGDGKLYCWGDGGSGKLGDGSLISKNTPSPVSTATLSGGSSYVRLSAGLAHTCAVTNDGRIHCWGFNSYGVLGTGDKVDRSSPTPIVAPSGGNPLFFTQVSAGRLHSCALTGDGKAYCWGSNSSGQLGDGTNTEKLTPSPVNISALSPGISFVSISAGNYHTCALAMDGVSYCWGQGTSGQLGNGLSANANSPKQVSGGGGFKTVVAGSKHTCAIERGYAWCWGLGSAGQLGNASTTNQNLPVPVKPASENWSQTYVSLTVGSSQSFTCGVDIYGKPFCWGDDSAGQLGDGGANEGKNIPTWVNTTGMN